MIQQSPYCVNLPNKSLHTVFLFLFILCGYPSTHAQHNGEQQIAVADRLKQLEVAYGVSFSYADSVLEGLSVSPIPTDSLEASLQNIEQQTLLTFHRLSKRFIAVNYEINKPIRVCGFVRKQGTNRGISEAIIQSRQGVVITDRKGYFEIDSLTANDSLMIQRLGYTPRIVQALSLRNCSNIYLKELITFLQPIVITDYLTEGITLKPAGVFMIKTEEFGMLPGLLEPDVLHSIQSLPGIHSFNETISNINIRGGTNDQNLVLWDEIRMYQTGHFFGLISAFNPYASDHLTLIKNGTPSSYGKGVSGTIAIQSNDDIASQFSGTMGINMLFGDLAIKVPLTKKSSVELSGRRSLSNLWESPTYKAYFDRAFRDSELFNPSANTLIANDQFGFYDYSLSYQLKPNDTDKITAQILNIANDLQYTESADINGAFISKTSSLSQQSMVGGFRYKKQWDRRFSSRINLTMSQYRLDAVNNDLSKNQELRQSNEVLDLGLKLETGMILSPQHDVNLGYEVNEVGITNEEDLNDPNFRRLKREILRTHALFGQWAFTSKTKGTILSAGARATYFDKFGQWRIEPRLILSQPVSSRLSIEVLGELKSQATTQIIDFQTDFLGIEKRRWVLSNERDIPLIKSNQLSLGVNYTYKKWLVTLEAYNKNVNSIITSSQGFQNQFQFVRSPGSYTVNGLDFLINRKTNRISTWISYAIAHNTYTFDELRPVTFPNNLDITHSLTGGTRLHYQRWSGSVGFNYRTGRPYTAPDPQVPIKDGTINYGVPNAARVEDYLRMDISLSYHFKMSKQIKGKVGVSIWNLANRKNATSIYYQFNPSEKINRIKQEALGRTINIGMRLNF